MTSDNRRKAKRTRTRRDAISAWKAPGQTSLSRIRDISLTGAFLTAPDPPACGSSIELILRLPGGDLRARGLVSRSMPGKGMGVRFVQMRPEDRAKLNQFLSRYTEAPANAAPAGTEATQAQAGAAQPWTPPPAAASSAAPPAAPSVTDANAPRGATAGRSAAAPPDPEIFERELATLVELAHRGTYYQLLGVTHDSPGTEIKRKYYALAKRFHPDLHMERTDLIVPLKSLMETLADAYRTLKDEKGREAYDRKLTAKKAFQMDRSKTASQESFEECAARADEHLRSRNFVASIVWLRKCVIFQPESSKYHTMLARSLATVLAYRDEAIRTFELAIKLDPWNTEAYFRFGEFYEAMELPWRAQQLYAKILEVNPDHAAARKKIAAAEQQQAESKKPGAKLPRIFSLWREA